MPRLRFALLHDGAGLERWQQRCLEELEPCAELAWALASPATPRTARGSRPLRWYGRRVAEAREAGLPDEIARLPPPPTGAAADGPDFVLGLGNVEVLPETIHSARLGVWRFEHEHVGTGLPFFAEVYADEPTTCVSLLALTPAGASVLQEGVFRTDRRSYVSSRNRIQDAIAAWPARACMRAIGDGLAGLPLSVAASAREEPRSLARFAGKVIRRRLGLAWRRLFRHPQWNVGVLRRPVATLLRPDANWDADVDWIPLDGKAGFVADPFGVERDGGLYVFCERFDYGDSRGRICVLDLREGLVTETADALPLRVHASYPYLLDLEDGLHLIPETAGAGEVALYRAADVYGPWEKVAALLERFPGVDPTVFRHDERWWLMCTRKGPQEDVELLVWHASALTGPWTPHERNPVKTDVRGARPAGPPFVHAGELYRPAQDCSETYGGRIALQHVTRLTPTEFTEETVAVLAASPRGPFPIGPHTLTPVGDVVLVDARRTVFVWAALHAFLVIWMGAIAKAILRRR